MVYDYPETGDDNWGPDTTDWASAVTTGMLQKAGGTFTLTADVDFGANFGLKSLYYKTRTSNIADAGQFRLARADVINWRNQANGGNLTLGVSASDVLQFNGADIQGSISVSDTDTIDLTFAADTLSADVKSDCITNAMVNSAAAIAFSKLATLTSGNILVGSAGNVVTSVTMSGDATIIASGALTIAANAVTNAKLAEMATLTIKGNNTGGTTEALDLTATQVTAMLDDVVGDAGAGGTAGLVPAPAAGDTAAGKFLKADGTWEAPSGAGDVVGPASATDNGFARFDGTTGKLLKDSPASITNADVVAAAAIAVNKLAALTASRAVVSDGSGFVSAATTTATEIGYVNGVTSAIQTQINTKQTRSTLTTKGDLYVATASDTVAREGVGLNGQILTADSAVTNGLKWASPGAMVTSKSFADTPYTVTTESQLLVDTSGGAVTINLPAGAANRQIRITKTTTDFNAVTIDGDSSEQIRDSGTSANTTTINTGGESVLLTWDGTLWEVTDRRVPSYWAASTVTALWTTNTTTTSFMKRVGDSAFFRVKIATGGQPDAGNLSITLPFTIATAKLTSTSSFEGFGQVTLSDSDSSVYVGKLTYSSSTILLLKNLTTNGTSVALGQTTRTAPFTFGSGDYLTMEFDVPVSGWNG